MKKLEEVSYPKSELAMIYFPKASSPHVAQNRLNAWIKSCPELVEALGHCHQPKHAKYYLAEAVRQIVSYLGEP